MNDKPYKTEFVYTKASRIKDSRYLYEYPKHWFENPGKKAIEVRDVKFIAAGRLMILYNFAIVKGSEEFRPLIRVSLSEGDSMNVFNETLKHDLLYLHSVKNNSIEPFEYQIGYNYSDNSFDFIISSNNNIYFKFDLAEKYSSNDFQQCMGINDSVFQNFGKYGAKLISKEQLIFSLPSNVEIGFDINENINKIKFHNVWNRGIVAVKSSLSNIGDESFLCIANDSLAPTKFYPVNGFNSSFEITLYSVTGGERIILPKDGRDIVIVELILIAY